MGQRGPHHNLPSKADHNTTCLDLPAQSSALDKQSVIILLSRLRSMQYMLFQLLYNNAPDGLL